MDGQTILSGDLPRLLWVKPWRHLDDFLSVHFVNYDVDFEAGAASADGSDPARSDVAGRIRCPKRAAWLTPGSDAVDLELKVAHGRAGVTIPSVRVYGVLVLGPEGLDGEPSRPARRAGHARRGREWPAGRRTLCLLPGQGPTPLRRRRCSWRPRKPATRNTWHGSKRPARPPTPSGHSTSVPPETQRSVVGRGCRQPLRSGRRLRLAPAAGRHRPDARGDLLRHAQKYGGRFVTNRNAARLLFWPYKKPPPRPVQTNLGSGAPHRFRVDVEPGVYAVRVVTTNPSWTNRNFQVSGMVSANGRVQLLDTTHDKGAIQFARVRGSYEPGQARFHLWRPDRLGRRHAHGHPGSRPRRRRRTPLCQWRVSPRHPNPEWYPITWTSTPLESQLANPPADTWTPLIATDSGVAVVDLGTNRQAEIGDVVYAAAAVTAAAAGPRTLHFGTSSSAQLWLNGRPLGYVPNEKGVREGEFTVRVDLRAGENTLVVKLQRFWERRWMFYAELD